MYTTRMCIILRASKRVSTTFLFLPFRPSLSVPKLPPSSPAPRPRREHVRTIIHDIGYYIILLPLRYASRLQPRRVVRQLAGCVSVHSSACDVYSLDYRRRWSITVNGAAVVTFCPTESEPVAAGPLVVTYVRSTHTRLLNGLRPSRIEWEKVVRLDSSAKLRIFEIKFLLFFAFFTVVVFLITL